MQTAFTAEQLARPRIAQADAILRTCVHYGFCTATCPTYVLFRDENDFPRGRIDLIRAMLEKGGAPDREDRPPSRPLPVLPLLRHHLRGQGRLRAPDRYRAQPYREALSQAAGGAGVACSAGNDLALSARGLAPRCGWRGSRGRLRGCCRSGSPISLTWPARPAQPEFLPAERLSRRKAASACASLLLAGCAQQALDRDINAATIRRPAPAWLRRW